jgi:GlpG protein
MRLIGQLRDSGPARAFSDFLVSRNIHHQADRESDGSWSIWVRDEHQVVEAREWLSRFTADPQATEFGQASADAMKVRLAEEQALDAYRRRVRSRKNIFAGFGTHGVGVLTYALIVTCIVVAVYSKLGYDPEVLRHFFISDPETATNRSLHEVFAGEVWRLFTPIFIHFGPIHLIFNLMWLYQLGCMIEARQSSGQLLAIVAVTALCSNLAQYYVTDHATFGGMSGVVYGLAGYVWIRGTYDRASGLFLDSQNVVMLLAWLVICYTGIMGPVANTAHLAGLIVGMVWGRLSAFAALRK